MKQLKYFKTNLQYNILLIHKRKLSEDDCVEMTSMPDGSIQKHFSDKQTMHPIQVMLRSNPFERKGKNNPKKVAQKKLLQSLKPGSKVLYLCPPYYGCVGTVLSKAGKLNKQQSMTLNIQLSPSEAEKTNIATSKRLISQFQPRYMSDTALTKKLGVSYRVLGMLTSMVNAKDSKGNNVG